MVAANNPAYSEEVKSSFVTMPSSYLSVVLSLIQLMAAASMRVDSEQHDVWLADLSSKSGNLAGEDLAYDYAGLATSAYDFDSEEASHKPWIQSILHRFEALNTDVADELSRRNADSSSLVLHRPRTFAITAGGPGCGKSYATNTILSGASTLGRPLGPREDFVVVTPDDVREHSAAFREILRIAKIENRTLPRNLVQDSNLEFLVQGKIEQGKNWLQLGRNFLDEEVEEHIFEKGGKTSIIYDTMCATAGFCERLLQMAKEAGYRRLAVVYANVDPDCAVFRAGELRARKSGRIVPEDFVRNAHKSAEENVPLVMKEAQKLMPNSWITVTSSPKQGSTLDRHSCPAKVEYTVMAAWKKRSRPSGRGRGRKRRRGRGRARK